MMKASIIKKMMTGALAVSLVMAPVMSVSATTTTPTTPSVVEEAVASGTSTTSSSSASSSTSSVSSASGESSVVAEVPTTSSVAGVRTTVGGVYLASSVNGTAVTTGVSTIAQGYGLTGSERPYSKFSNLDPKKSPLAKAAIDAAAASQGATVGPMINIELGKMSAGKYSLLPADGPAIRIAFGIPKNFARSNATYAVVCVRAGGAVSILPDVDDNVNTITFDTTGGAGAYAIIRY